MSAEVSDPSEVSEHITVEAEPPEIYQAVSDLHRMVRWSPECFAVWVWRRRRGMPHRFVGFNRRGPFVWFTTCRVVTAEPNHEFAFDVTTFGLPVSRWGYRMAKAAAGTDVTEYWRDRRGRGALLLGRVFTGRVAYDRPAANREGMRTTLARLKQELEQTKPSP
ncbi:MAG: SRPBCC family protein [Sporichthyaceae bacterium]|nr:SRPBCC family protein [Sporichthyaceae bacterium]